MKIGEVPQGALVIHRDRFLDTARRLAAKDRNGRADPEDVAIRTSVDQCSISNFSLNRRL